MKDRILQSYLQDFCREEGYEDLKEPEAFERFVNHCIIAREHADTFDLDNICIGGGNDISLDGVAILVNDRLVYSKEEIDYFKTTFRRFDIKFIFIQAKTSSSFDMGDIGNFLFGVKSFFFSGSSLVRHEDIRYLQSLTEHIYSNSIDMDLAPECLMFYVTTGNWQDDANLRARIDSGVTELKQTNLFSQVHFASVDAESLKDLYKELKRKIVTEVSFDKHTILPKIDKVQEAYIGILPCQEYIKLITDKDGKLRRNLFDDNVRDYQGNNPVNNEIVETVRDASQSIMTPRN